MGARRNAAPPRASWPIGAGCRCTAIRFIQVRETVM
jgi:hypothetical protein